MKVIGIVCSPRKGGNTEILIDRALEASREFGAQETDIIHLSGKHIAPCDGCLSCVKTAKCHIKDDMEAIYPRLLEADGIIIGTPVYFWGITAQAKILIDRTNCWSQGHRAIFLNVNQTPGNRVEGLRNKVGGIIAVTHRAGGTQAVRQVSDFFRIHRMVEAGAAIAYGQKKGEVRNDEQGMREAWLVGKAMVRKINLVQGIR